MQINDVTVEQEQSVACDVERILKAKSVNPAADTSNEETGIHRLVYALYNLTDDETAAVESRYANTMTFPDQSHINRVRDALWQRYSNGASVMVGSGFSRNSVPSVPQAITLPTWEEVTSRLHSELYPQESDTSYFNQLRTAQEYEAAFGRGALHDALRRLVRHEEHHPGSTHQRLLQLPWQDIYTTNWDTLLERTRFNVVERHYSVVNNVDEIPMGKRPRVVKLHGSFPAQFPLIVTEEDYRTYPTTFAPFVNTVQQAMMETVFLLIGFSGDDPNFLNWSGWIRDNLGASAPKIYLAGYLELSPHRRRMLEERNVVPIDLARHPNANHWPESANTRREYATQWLLHTLENGEPYKITEWPSPSSPQRHPIPDQLRPVGEATAPCPREEPNAPDRQSSQGDDLAQTVREATDVWNHNRKMYPGWLVLPSINRHAVSTNTHSWVSATLRAIEHLTPAERLQAVQELAWRKKILLEPFEQGFLTSTESTLALFDCRNRTIKGEKAPNADWETIRENWRNTAVELLVEYRWNHDQEAFRRLIEDLRGFVDEDPEIQQSIFQEQCLWALYDLDFTELGRLLTKWQTENCDPVWAIRKSAILSEMGRDDEAEQLRRQAMETIRAMPTGERSVAGPSREGWAMLATSSLQNYQTIAGRMDELAALKCDAMHERDVITKGVDSSRQDVDPPSFDVGTRPVRHRFYNNYYQLVAAYQAIRLAEVAGLPPCAMVLHEFSGQTSFHFPTDVAMKIMKLAADKLAGWNHELAIRLVLRACSSEADETLERVLSRTSVVTLTTQQADNLAQSCWRAIENALPNLGHQVHQWRLNVAIEALSRLAVRVPHDQVETIFDQALELCQNQQLARGTGWTPIRHLLHRSWESLSAERRSSRIIDLLKAPIAGLDGPSPLTEYNWPDPAEVLATASDVLRRTPGNEQQWQATVDLVARGLVGSPAARYRASTRMSHLVQSGQLTDAETRRIAQALWDEQYTAPDGLPSRSTLYDWGFLVVPEPTPGMAQEHFRNKWLSGESELSDYRTIELGQDLGDGLNRNPKDVESRLWQVGHSIHSLHESGQLLELSDTEKQHLAELVETWAEAPLPERSALEDPMFGNYYSNRTNAVAQVLPAVIREISPPASSLGEKIYEKVRHLIAIQVPAFDLAPTIVQIAPDRLEDVATMLRVGITSSTNELAANAASGMLLWLSESSDAKSGTPTPPNHLVREIGVAIAYRRGPSLVGALQAARWIFDSGTGASKETIIQLVEDGLEYLATELSYDRDHENPDGIPLLRLLCTELATAMAKDGQDQHHAVARWLEIAKEDPLPEVRNAVRA